MSETTLMPMGQLRWRCRRGMRELDVLLMKFLELRYSSLSRAEKETFEAMLQLQDPDLNAMLMGKLQPESVELQAMIALLLEVAGEPHPLG